MAQFDRSILKALNLLSIIAEAEDGLRLTEVAKQGGYPLSTTHRLLGTLSQHGYVEHDPTTGRYYLGVKILTLQAQGIRKRHIGRRAFPHLTNLRKQIGETVNLGVLSEKNVVYLETFAPDTSFSFYAPPGTRMPIHCTAMGKVLLAHLPDELRQNLLHSLEMKPYTVKTTTSATALEAELKEIVKRGFAVDDQEYALGVRCVAAPIRDHSGQVVAAVSVTALADQLARGKRESEVADILKRTCLDISISLGYQAQPEREPVARRSNRKSGTSRIAVGP